ncbi:hypothetical protein SAMN04488003_1216 [Loktanella fryxellensis]|uniref:Uncharacterized protein n=1 Tax=Loktanella fryxellensis TaxID=245187 RepID=A0A1H8HJ12_9RHOB|nr:hypothetical protein [Loktanella fryxellensis]SEN55508.1 hypothetical protein SAMN04488003_1216 [Loktanella fryxellensis]
MTKPMTMLDVARCDAQDLHKKISANIAKAEHATWADVTAIQAEIATLVSKMQALAADQAGDVKAGIGAAIAKLEAAGHVVEDKAGAAKDGVRRANAAMLDSTHKATQSLSAAVAAGRTRLALAIAPKAVTA